MSKPGTRNEQTLSNLQRTIGGKALTGELSLVPTLTVVSTR